MLAAATALAASGCSTGRIEIDHKKAESLARQIGAVRGAVQSASCPSGIEAKKGKDFDCTITYSGGAKRRITIHQVDDKGRIRTSVADLH